MGAAMCGNVLGNVWYCGWYVWQCGNVWDVLDCVALHTAVHCGMQDLGRKPLMGSLGQWTSVSGVSSVSGGIPGTV